ncbi:LysR family transcriptional regulator ArgP [Nocardioides ferulae]|uniref:LysR family transcriptional regulator ArgP n=1 Tax=Nocardioides ferulae TaxID=2340821 RepID=UPI000EB33C36|nr:LysR family transcriptional regulator ArgP [Nocardioides ferulae]
MDPQPAQLAALAAVADHGTFEAAARALQVTPSAVSQRIRALETAVGQVVVRRTAPCRPTVAGERLLRLARQVQLLYDEARAELSGAGAGPQGRLPVAVNADSLATWFRDVVAEIGGWPGVALQLQVEDQAYSVDHLRRGEVLAAVTSDPVPVQGCSVEPLGVLRYRPAAAPGFAERWRVGRGHDWAAMPVVVFNDLDTLQHDLLRGRGVDQSPPVVHRVPTSADFLAAVRSGLGWGVLPEPQLEPAVADGSLVPLAGRARVDVPLHWQRWRLGSPLLDRLTAAVRAAARTQLRPGRPAGAQ